MKKQIRKAKAKLTRVEMTPFPVWKKWYFLATSAVGVTWLIYKALEFLGVKP